MMNLPADLSNQISAKFINQATLLRQINEGTRRNITLYRMMPARQSFKSAVFTVLPMNNRLIIQRDIALTERPFQLRQQSNFLDGGNSQIAGIEGKTILAGGLGHIHSRIGIAHQLLRRRTVLRKKTDTDTDSGRYFPTINNHRMLQCLNDGFCHCRDLLCRINIGQHQSKLIAALPGQSVSIADTGIQSTCHLTQ